MRGYMVPPRSTEPETTPAREYAVFGPWQTVWQRHHRMAADGTWDAVQARLHEHADRAGLIDWSVSVDATIVRAHQHATNITRLKKGYIELQESTDRAA